MTGSSNFVQVLEYTSETSEVPISITFLMDRENGLAQIRQTVTRKQTEVATVWEGPLRSLMFALATAEPHKAAQDEDMRMLKPDDCHIEVDGEVLACNLSNIFFLPCGMTEEMLRKIQIAKQGV